MSAEREQPPERRLERTQAELQEDLKRLEGDIEEAEGAAKRRPEAGDGGPAGDWEDTDDQAGGEDPEGAGERES